MSTVLLVIQIMVAVSMIVIILLQRSEGGALGMGGGGGGFVTGRGAANLLTRITAILAAIFFITSLALGIFGHKPAPTSAVGTVTPTSSSAPGENAPESLQPLRLRKSKPETPPAQAPAAPEQVPAQPQVPQSQ
jgi:preprotein translocase subunit SecG